MEIRLFMTRSQQTNELKVGVKLWAVCMPRPRGHTPEQTFCLDLRKMCDKTKVRQSVTISKLELKLHPKYFGMKNFVEKK